MGVNKNFRQLFYLQIYYSHYIVVVHWIDGFVAMSGVITLELFLLGLFGVLWAIFGGATYRAPYTIFLVYDALEGLPPKYLPPQVTQCPWNLKQYFLHTTDSRSHQSGHMYLHAPPPRISPFRILELSCHTVCYTMWLTHQCQVLGVLSLSGPDGFQTHSQNHQSRAPI
jgi:hypothetical protein